LFLAILIVKKPLSSSTPNPLPVVVARTVAGCPFTVSVPLVIVSTPDKLTAKVPTVVAFAIPDAATSAATADAAKDAFPKSMRPSPNVLF
jgi:hypothetical protein